MKFLQEAIRSIKRLDAEQPADDESELPPEEQDIDFDDLDGLDLDLDGEDENAPDEGDADPELSDTDEFPMDDENFDPAMGSSGGASGEAGGEESDGELGDDFGQDEENPDLDQVANSATEDPDKQGVIRTVKNAHLVYKRQSGEGGFEELWIYNVGTLKDELEVRKAILAGTDIPVNRTSSPDGAQQYSIWSAGNAEMVHITGLQN